MRHAAGRVPSMPHMRDDRAHAARGRRRRRRPVPDSVAGRARAGRRADRVVEPDLSNAAPFLAAALVTGGWVTVRGWPRAPPSRARAARPADRDGRRGRARPPTGSTVTRHRSRIARLDADLRDVGELTPVLAALAALADGPSPLPGIAHIRGHETDRLAALAKELDAARRRCAASCPTAWSIRPRPLPAAGCTPTTTTGWRTPAAVLGLAVDGVEVEDVARRRQDAAGLPRACGRRCSARRPGSAVSRRIDSASSDEDDVRVRPSRRCTARAPRIRPSHEDAAAGMVLAVDRGRLTVRGRGRRRPVVTAMRARELGRTAWWSATRSRVVGDTSGAHGHPGPDRRASRTAHSVLRRTADDTDPIERVVVANADQLVIVTALADPRAARRASSTAAWSPPTTAASSRCCA